MPKKPGIHTFVIASHIKMSQQNIKYPLIISYHYPRSLLQFQNITIIFHYHEGKSNIMRGNPISCGEMTMESALNTVKEKEKEQSDGTPFVNDSRMWAIPCGRAAMLSCSLFTYRCIYNIPFKCCKLQSGMRIFISTLQMLVTHELH